MASAATEAGFDSRVQKLAYSTWTDKDGEPSTSQQSRASRSDNAYLSLIDGQGRGAGATGVILGRA